MDIDRRGGGGATDDTNTKGPLGVDVVEARRQAQPDSPSPSRGSRSSWIAAVVVGLHTAIRPHPLWTDGRHCTHKCLTVSPAPSSARVPERQYAVSLKQSKSKTILCCLPESLLAKLSNSTTLGSLTLFLKRTINCKIQPVKLNFPKAPPEMTS